MKYNRVVCINMDRRPEKWEEFLAGIPEDFPFGTVERFPAIDGRMVPPPQWWKGGKGAWGCFCSHRRIIEDCLNTNTENVLIFEDDALFLPDFAENVRTFHANLPDDAQWIYYGGQHLCVAVNQPQPVNDEVFRPYNVNRTHAYGVRGRAAMEVILKHLNRKDWTTSHHIDHHYGRIHQRGDLGIYCPPKWLVDQRAGRSDVACREKTHHHWADAEIIPEKLSSPFYAVLGCHSSGSSAVAGVLYHLGVHLGNTLVGAHGKPPINGGEALDLHRLFSSSAPVPSTAHQLPWSKLHKRLKVFINRRRMEATNRDTVAAGKYPQLATCGDILQELCGETLRLVVCNRDLEASVKSLHRRFPRHTHEELYLHQKWIHDSILTLCETVPREHQHHIDFTDLCATPAPIIHSLAAFIRPHSTPDQIAAAIEYVQPDLRHF